MKTIAAFLVSAFVSVAFAEIYTYAPVEFIQTDGHSYIDTGIPGNAKKIQQRARFQMLEVPSSETYVGVFGSYGPNGWGPERCVGYESCAFFVNSKMMLPTYTGSNTGGYYHDAPVKNGWYDIYLHDGFSQNYQSTVAYSSVTGVGYNWASLKDGEFSTLLVGNVNNTASELYTQLGSVMPMRWYYYEAIEHDTGTSLIKLTPVKCVETGVFGMIDEVSGRFFASEVDDHPFIGPEYVAWRGADHVYPANAVVSVPAGTTNRVTNADVPTLNNLGGILVEDETSVFAFTNFTAATDIYVPFYGRGEIRHEYGNVKEHKLYGDNRAFAGLHTLHRALVGLYNQYSLGWTNRVSHFANDNGHLQCKSSGTNSVHLRLCGTGSLARMIQVNAAKTVFAGALELDLAKELNLHGGDNNGELAFTGPVTNVQDESFYRILISRNVKFAGNVERFFGKCWLTSSGTVSLGGRIHFIGRAHNHYLNPQEYGQVGASSGGTVAFLSDNVLDKDVIFLMGWGYTADLTPKGTVDLNGFDQRVGRLITGVKAPFDGLVRPQASNLVIKSSRPAILKVCNTAVMGHGGSILNLPGCWPGRVNGAASVEIDTSGSIETPGNVSFTCAQSDTTGGLYARRGKITLYETASFPNLSELVASGEGRIETFSSAVGGADLHVALTNCTLTAPMVPLTIAENCVLTARTAIVTRGTATRWLKVGDYTCAELPGLIGGKGTLKVLEYAGKKGFSILVK